MGRGDESGTEETNQYRKLGDERRNKGERDKKCANVFESCR